MQKGSSFSVISHYENQRASMHEIQNACLTFLAEVSSFAQTPQCEAPTRQASERKLLAWWTAICPRAAKKQRRVEVATLPSAALMPSAGI